MSRCSKATSPASASACRSSRQSIRARCSPGRWRSWGISTRLPRLAVRQSGSPRRSTTPTPSSSPASGSPPSICGAVRTCRTGDVPGIFALVASPLASAYCLAGRADAALDLLKKAIEQAIAIGDPFGHLLRAAGRAEAYLLVGRAADALPLAQRGVEICKAVKSRGVRGWALRLMGEVAAAQTPPLVDEAEAAYREALKMAQEMGMRPLEARCHLGLGGLYRRTGEGGLAVDHLTTARSMFREMSMRYWLEKAEAESHNLA